MDVLTEGHHGVAALDSSGLKKKAVEGVQEREGGSGKVQWKGMQRFVRTSLTRANFWFVR